MPGSATDLLRELEYEGKMTRITRHATERAKERGISREELLIGSGSNRTVIKKDNTIITAYHNDTKSAHIAERRVVALSKEAKVHTNPDIWYRCTNDNDGVFTTTVDCKDSKNIHFIIGRKGATIRCLQGLLVTRVGNGIVWFEENHYFRICTRRQEETLFMAHLLQTLAALSKKQLRILKDTLRYVDILFIRELSDKGLRTLESKYSVAFFRNGMTLYVLVLKKSPNTWDAFLERIHMLKEPELAQLKVECEMTHV